MTRTSTALALACVMAVTTPAQAEFISGNRLLSDLTSDKSLEFGYGMGYVVGVADAGMGVTHCAPAAVSVGQIVDMVTVHLKSVPSARHLSGDSHVTYVLSKAWPCAKKNGEKSI